jgi:hypothetical protein
VDETFIGIRKGVTPKQGIGHKMKVLSLLERNTGAKRSIVLDDMKPATIAALVSANVAHEAHLMTDQADHYVRVGKTFAAHESTNHSKGEYVRYSTPPSSTPTPSKARSASSSAA